MQTTYDEMIKDIWKDSTFCDYWKRIPRGVDMESLETYFVDFIIEHYENNEFFIQMMDEIQTDFIDYDLFKQRIDNMDHNDVINMTFDEEKHCMIYSNYDSIINMSLDMLWGFTMPRRYPPHFCNLVPRQMYNQRFFRQYDDEKLAEFYASVEKKVWETYFSRNHYVLK